MSLSTLPDLCLLAILDRIPLYDLLATTNRVCHRWARLRPIACHRRHSFILIEGGFYRDALFDSLGIDDGILHKVTNDDGTVYHKYTVDYEIKQHSFVFSRLSDHAIEQLVKLLPNISSLQIYRSVGSWPIIEQINQLLRNWSPKLIQFNLYLNYYSDVVMFFKEKLDSLFDRINSLSALKRLRIQLNLTFPDSKLVTKLKILPQLEQFEYNGMRNIPFEKYIEDNIEDALKQPNCALKRINLGYIENDRYIQLSPKLLSLMSNCIIFPTQLNVAGLSSILSRVSFLETLTISLHSFKISYVQLISLLSHLPRLIFLQLRGVPEAFFTPITIEPCPLPSIKALNFSLNTSLPHKRIRNLSLPTIFPNVQVIKLSHITPKCVECDYKIDHSVIITPILTIKLTECSNATLKSLMVECTKLRTIYCTRNILGNVVEHVFTRENDGQVVIQRR